MSKAFTKDDAPDSLLVVPPRAPLPEGTPNYVTPRGLARLHAERAELESERAGCGPADEDAERTRVTATLLARLAELDARIATVELVASSAHHDEVRFGATVTVRSEAGVEKRYKIVGVDEADAAHEPVGLVAFVAPIARALLGKRVGDVATVRSPRGVEELEVVAVEYDAGADEVSAGPAR